MNGARFRSRFSPSRNMGISLGHNAWTLPAVNALSAAESKLPANERMLQDAVRRATNAKAGITMLVLHAAALPDVAARPHRARLARAVLDDAAEQVDGEVFRLTNGDLVLLARRPGARLGPAGLAGTLGRLFDHPPEACVRYVSCWPLDQSASEAAAYVASRVADAADQPPVLASLPLAASAWPGAVLSAGPVWDLLNRQTAVRLPRPSDPPQAAFIPLHHSLSFSISTLQARAPLTAADLDRCMARFLAGGLEPALLSQMLSSLADPPARRGASFAGLARTAPVFLALGLRALATGAFANLARASPPGALGVELPWVEATVDPGLFARVRALLQALKVPWVLSGLSHGGLLFGTPERLAPDLFKLDWSPALASGQADRQPAIDAALRAIGPARLILTGVETEAAVRWGVARGVLGFQGPYVEAMLAAHRMQGCSHARHCTLTQCSQRATAINSAGRAGCQRPDLLDGGRSAAREASP